MQKEIQTNREIVCPCKRWKREADKNKCRNATQKRETNRERGRERERELKKVRARVRV